jgi:hypothetical protein
MDSLLSMVQLLQGSAPPLAAKATSLIEEEIPSTPPFRKGENNKLL